MRYTIIAKEIFSESAILFDSNILVDNDLISGIGCEWSEYVIDLSEYKLLPGLIDIHIHGGNGYDVMDNTFEALNGLSKYKVKEGVTAFCPSTVTTSMEKIKESIKNIKWTMSNGVEGAKIIGTFLEGPYIDRKYKGAHPENLIREISLSEMKELVELGQGALTSFGIAPNMNNSLEAIQYLKENNVNVKIGHSGATYEQASQAIEKGANIAIHTFNAMSPFSHREPGMVGAILSNKEIYTEIICDLIHVHPVCIDILTRLKGSDKIILVTDSMMAAGLPDGDYMLGDLKVQVQNGIARTMEGALAGSTIRLIDAVKNIHEKIGVSLFDAVRMATLNPATALGIQSKIGSIRVGKKADLIAINDNFEVKFVMIEGKIILR